MRVVGHLIEVGEAVGVDERVAVGVVEVERAERAVRAALLPVVVETDVAVAKVTQRSGHAVDHAVLGINRRRRRWRWPVVSRAAAGGGELFPTVE